MFPEWKKQTGQYANFNYRDLQPGFLFNTLYDKTKQNKNAQLKANTGYLEGLINNAQSRDDITKAQDAMQNIHGGYNSEAIARDLTSANKYIANREREKIEDERYDEDFKTRNEHWKANHYIDLANLLLKRKAAKDMQKREEDNRWAYTIGPDGTIKKVEKGKLPVYKQLNQITNTFGKARQNANETLINYSKQIESLANAYKNAEAQGNTKAAELLNNQIKKLEQEAASYQSVYDNVMKDGKVNTAGLGLAKAINKIKSKKEKATEERQKEQVKQALKEQNALFDLNNKSIQNIVKLASNDKEFLRWYTGEYKRPIPTDAQKIKEAYQLYLAK